MAIEREEIERLKKDSDDERGILNRATWSRLREMLLGQTATAAPKGVKKGVEITEDGSWLSFTLYYSKPRLAAVPND